MNAHEMYKELNKPEVCEGLEEWIRVKLFAVMKSSISMTAHISTDSVQWSQGAFLRAMTNLGYRITVECDDRPCAQPYYKIAIEFNERSIKPRR